MSDSLRPHESQHFRPPCSSPTPRVHPDSCASSQWCHPAISSSVVPFSSCTQSLPASESFPMSQLFAWRPKYWSFSLSLSPSNEHYTPSIYLSYNGKSVPFHHSLSFSYVPTAESGNKKSILIFYELWFCLLDSTYEWDHVDLYFSVLHFA